MGFIWLRTIRFNRVGLTLVFKDLRDSPSTAYRRVSTSTALYVGMLILGMIYLLFRIGIDYWPKLVELEYVSSNCHFATSD